MHFEVVFLQLGETRHAVKFHSQMGNALGSDESTENGFYLGAHTVNWILFWVCGFTEPTNVYEVKSCANTHIVVESGGLL